MERTLVIVKPDGVSRRLDAKVFRRIHRLDLNLEKYARRLATRDEAEAHYGHLKDKIDDYDGLIDFMLSGPIDIMIWEGKPGAIAAVRKLVGATKPEDRVPGTIRGDYSYDLRKNVVHASDSAESAEREIAIWFPKWGRKKYNIQYTCAEPTETAAE